MNRKVNTLGKSFYSPSLTDVAGLDANVGFRKHHHIVYTQNFERVLFLELTVPCASFSFQLKTKKLNLLGYPLITIDKTRTPAQVNLFFAFLRGIPNTNGDEGFSSACIN